ncbi:MFS transporter [Tistrella bauzanensis]
MAAKTDRTAAWAFWIVITAIIVGQAAGTIYLPSLAALARDLDTDRRMAQLTLSICLIGNGAGQLFYGPLADRAGRRPALLIGLGLLSVGSAGAMVAGDVTTLMIFRFVQGLGAAAGRWSGAVCCAMPCRPTGWCWRCRRWAWRWHWRRAAPR